MAFENMDGTWLVLGAVGALALVNTVKGSRLVGSSTLKANQVEVHLTKSGLGWTVAGIGVLSDPAVTTTQGRTPWKEAKKDTLARAKKLSNSDGIQVSVVSPKAGLAGSRGRRGTVKKTFGRAATTWTDVAIPTAPGGSYTVPLMEATYWVHRDGKIEQELVLKNLRFGRKSFTEKKDALTYLRTLVNQLRKGGFTPVRTFEGNRRMKVAASR